MLLEKMVTCFGFYYLVATHLWIWSSLLLQGAQTVPMLGKLMRQHIYYFKDVSPEALADPVWEQVQQSYLSQFDRSPHSSSFQAHDVEDKDDFYYYQSPEEEATVIHEYGQEEYDNIEPDIIRHGNDRVENTDNDFYNDIPDSDYITKDKFHDDEYNYGNEEENYFESESSPFHTTPKHDTNIQFHDGVLYKDKTNQYNFGNEEYLETELNGHGEDANYPIHAFIDPTHDNVDEEIRYHDGDEYQLPPAHKQISHDDRYSDHGFHVDYSEEDYYSDGGNPVRKLLGHGAVLVFESEHPDNGGMWWNDLPYYDDGRYRFDPIGHKVIANERAPYRLRYSYILDTDQYFY